jgi:hypothetical protein
VIGGIEDGFSEPSIAFGYGPVHEYVSLHMLEPDYSPLVGYPIAHTPGTDGRQRLQAVIGDVHTRAVVLESSSGRPGAGHAG